MANTYTVVKGDTLWDLAQKFGTTVANLVNWNNITDPNFIVVGQILNIDSSGSSSSTQSLSSRATIKVFGLQSNTDRTMYATWTWDQDNTENYQVMWYYDTGDGVWFVGSDSTVEYKQSTYSAPSNAERVKFKVKPIAKKRKVNNTETAYWTAAWSTEKTYDFSNNPPSAPSTPSAKIEKYKLTVELDDLENLNATKIQFQVVKNNQSVYKSGMASISTGHVSYSCTVAAGNEYKVRCRSYRDGKYSDWTGYSDNVSTMPSAPSSIKTCKASSETSVYLEWAAANTATSYDIEYTTKKEYFDKSDQTSTTTGIEGTQFEKTGLETGQEYFFRVRAVNSNGESDWSPIKSVTIGKDPAAPTTWSSTTTVVTGESLTLYWVHNAEDESSQTYAELELIIGGVEETHTIKNSTDEEEKDKTSSYVINTSEFSEGTKILWRVRTAGITKVYGDWSVQRTVDVYAPATLELNVVDTNGDDIEVLNAFPFYIHGLAGPNTQAPIGYHLAISANESYETVDQVGNFKMVSAGDQIYSKYFDTNDPLMVEMSAGNIDLENNIAYTVTCTVSMNSGLTAESSVEFSVAWSDETYEPNAEIGIDKETYSASIRPYCENNNVAVEDIELAVYRREYDGGFTEIASGIPNSKNVFVTDPHPSLDYARYRIVATSTATGAVSYFDVPGYPVGGNEVIIQWDEDWSNFDSTNEDELEAPTWSGSMLKLPYDIDVSDSNSVDVALTKYTGRQHPVSYYGTQLGVSSTWNVSVPKTDKETLYALRRLSIWTGDVYVREPSGSGYWANVKVSFSQTHNEPIIPVTFNVIRVVGGI